MHCDLGPRPRETNEAPAAAEQSRPEGADDGAPGLSSQHSNVPVVAAWTLLSMALAQDLLTPSAVDPTAIKEQCPTTCAPSQVLPASACSGTGNFFGAAGVAHLLLVPFCC